MKKLLILLALVGLGYAVYKHLDYYKQENAQTWAEATDSFSG